MTTKPESTKLVTCADKLHNISHTLRDIKSEGAETWMARMEKSANASGEKHCWYYLGCLEALSSEWSNLILDEFARSVILLCGLVGTPEDVTRAHDITKNDL
jgi:hypothetical protein